MKVKVGGWAVFECEACGAEFAAVVTFGAEIYCPNCGKIDTVPEDIQLASGITLTNEKQS